MRARALRAAAEGTEAPAALCRGVGRENATDPEGIRGELYVSTKGEQGKCEKDHI